MKGKNVARIVIFTLIILFTTLYVTQAFGYYEYSNKKTNTLTEEAAKKFEKDIESGKTIKASNYLKEENDYNNNLSKAGLSVSKMISSSMAVSMVFPSSKSSIAILISEVPP